ncbi:hypothetical protein [Brucella intermedia]|uniref:hypothetical protein n=1 Tax=Brucella intermedia TaxID=94625 RepID=UPI00224B4218|nr:hypothetical protein [Brucella intermedia]
MSLQAATPRAGYRNGRARQKAHPRRTGPVGVSAIIMTGDFGPLGTKEVMFVFSRPEAGIEPFRRKAERRGRHMARRRYRIAAARRMDPARRRPYLRLRDRAGPKAGT